MFIVNDLKDSEIHTEKSTDAVPNPIKCLPSPSRLPGFQEAD